MSQYTRFPEPMEDQNPFQDPAVAQHSNNTGYATLDLYNPFDKPAGPPPPYEAASPPPAPAQTPPSRTTPTETRNYGSYNSQPAVNAATSELQRRQEELERKAQDLERRERELQSHSLGPGARLREREERCRRREPPCDDLQLGRLQERLMERDQLIKRLVEERHQLQLHPPVAGDNISLRPRDNKSRPGSVTPTMRKKEVESPRVTSIPCASIYDRNIFPHSSSSHPHSSTLPHQSSSHPHSSNHYSTSSLPHKHTSLSLSQHSSPTIPRSTRSRTSCIPPTPAPTAPLPVCPSPQTGIRYVSPSCQDPHTYFQGHSIRGPYLDLRGTEGLKQEWFTKYFSF